jgi:RNA polymerase sigma-70 factor (sigma-E family)
MSEPMDFEAFCLRQNAALIRFLTLYCGDVETARDIAQETLARVWAHWHKVQRMDRPDLWAKRVALNLANSQFRHRGVERGRLHLLVERNPSPGPDPSDRLQVQQALATLSPRQRTVILLRFLEDLSVEQTSELMGCSQGTVKKLTARALVGLRAVIGTDIEVASDA